MMYVHTIHNAIGNIFLIPNVLHRLTYVFALGLVS